MQIPHTGPVFYRVFTKIILWNVKTKILFGPLYSPISFFVMNKIMLLNNIVCIYTYITIIFIGFIHSIRIATGCYKPNI